MYTIAYFLGASLKGKERKHVFSDNSKNINYIEYVYLITTENFISKYILISYLIKYSLLSYKYPSIDVFRELLQISIEGYL